MLPPFHSCSQKFCNEHMPIDSVIYSTLCAMVERLSLLTAQDRHMEKKYKIGQR